MKRFKSLFFITLFGISSLFAQKAGWTLDKSHSSVGFSVKHMVISDVSGNFKDFDISFKSNKSDFTDASVDATIKVASINTDNEKRDGHLKTDDFFNAEKFPAITFKSTSFEKVGENKYKIAGDLTIRDVTKKVTFDATYNGSIKSPWGAEIYAWKATLPVNRFDFGLKWNKAIEAGGLIVGETVNITLNLELTKPAA
ncbi:MAG: YceI family protein [Ignavibacteriales bacterium]|nr:YceI family protein [Ignavibacteriales bacterium]